jgi:hypothetical protein
MNTESDHERAAQLIAQELVEGLSASNQRWLAQHLRECGRCAAEAAATQGALRSLKSLAIPVPNGLARRTQFRVHLRAQQQQQEEPRRRLMWFACGASWVFGAVTAPFVWRGLQWIALRIGVPPIVPEIGFGMWWALPAIAAVAIVIVETVKRESHEDWFRQQD